MTIIIGFKHGSRIHMACDSLVFETYTDGHMNLNGQDVNKFFRANNYFFGVSTGDMRITKACKQFLPKTFNFGGELESFNDKKAWVKEYLWPKLKTIYKDRLHQPEYGGHFIVASKLGVITFELPDDGRYYYDSGEKLSIQNFGAVGTGQHEALVSLHALYSSNVLQTKPELAMKIAVINTARFHKTTCRQPLQIQSMEIK